MSLLKYGTPGFTARFKPSARCFEDSQFKFTPTDAAALVSSSIKIPRSKNKYILNKYTYINIYKCTQYKEVNMVALTKHSSRGRRMPSQHAMIGEALGHFLGHLAVG